ATGGAAHPAGKTGAGAGRFAPVPGRAGGPAQRPGNRHLAAAPLRRLAGLRHHSDHRRGGRRMNELVSLVRRLVREELAAARGPLLGTVTALAAHESEDDANNYEADVALKHDGLELKKVPLAVPHVGVAAPPRVGDLVLVQFVGHDLQQPLITGRFYHE